MKQKYKYARRKCVNVKCRAYNQIKEVDYSYCSECGKKLVEIEKDKK